MHPRFRLGEYMTADPTIPVELGEEVLVALRDRRSFPRILKSRSDGLVSLEDIQGGMLTLPEGEVRSMDVIVMRSGLKPCREALAGEE
jgi:hypothetical protein